MPDISDSNFALNQLSKINWIVVNCSTPANLFHVLRRQIYLPFRKPLIISTPKSLLRHPSCRSPFDDMLECTEFQRIIPDCTNVANPKKLIFCTGKTYYDLVDARKTRGKEGEVIISRIEQMCPFPYDLFLSECRKYANAEIIFAQEEHKNQGCWQYAQQRMTTALAGRCFTYIYLKFNLIFLFYLYHIL